MMCITHSVQLSDSSTAICTSQHILRGVTMCLVITQAGIESTLCSPPPHTCIHTCSKSSKVEELKVLNYVSFFFFQKSFISLFILVIAGTTMAFPQSSFYAANRKEIYPQVLPRFGGDDNSNINSRFGENDSSTSSVVPPTTQTDSLHDPDVVSRVGTWPKERLPFWFLNSLHIGSHRRQNVPCVNCVNQESLQQPLPRSPFAQRN